MKKTLLLAFVAAITLAAHAQQNGVSTPYSRYGLGLLSERTSGFNSAMAGTGVAFSHPRQLNMANPASHARIDSLAFLLDVGASLQWSQQEVGNAAQRRKSAQFDYLSAGFRLAPGLGLGVGLLPYSNVGYRLQAQGQPLPNGTTGTVTPTTLYEGDGGLQEAYLALGYSPWKPLAVGVSASYLWGHIDHYARSSYNDAAIQSLRRGYETEIRSYRLDFGLQLGHSFHPKHHVQLGATYGLGHDLAGTSYLFNQTFQGATSGAGAVVGADTLAVKNAFQLPTSFGLGVAYTWNNRLRLGLDYRHEAWGATTAPVLGRDAKGWTYTAQKGQHKDRSRLSFGAEYVPNPQGLSWASRVRYRIGGSYATPYTQSGGIEGPKAYTASVGVGLPIINSRNNRSLLNISAEYVRYEPKMTGLLRENHFRITLGLSFNESWFQKIKFN